MILIGAITGNVSRFPGLQKSTGIPIIASIRTRKESPRYVGECSNPNITGEMSRVILVGSTNEQKSSGALSLGANYAGASSGGGRSRVVSLRASLDNSTYGTSFTVQPASFQALIIIKV